MLMCFLIRLLCFMFGILLESILGDYFCFKIHCFSSHQDHLENTLVCFFIAVFFFVGLFVMLYVWDIARRTIFVGLFEEDMIILRFIASRVTTHQDHLESTLVCLFIAVFLH